MAGISANGFEAKRLADIQADMNERLADIVDPVTGEFPFQNVSDDTILQQIVGIFAEQCADVWNAAASAYYQFDPLYNTGAGQSGTVQLNSILRRAGAQTIIEIKLTGRLNTIIPRGSIISDGQDFIFTTDSDVLIDATGEAYSTATRTVKSAEEIPNGVIVQILTPTSGWTGVTNTATISEGSDEETDEELRTRQQQSTYLTSYRLIESIYAAVRQVDGVIYARAYQNTSIFPADARGIPFKEVAVVASGGADEDIAQAIYYRLPTGQIGYGSTSVEIEDAQGMIENISFSRPEEIPIFIQLKISITTRADYPDNAPDLITQEIISFAEFGGVGKEDGFPPGADIIRTRLFTPINNISGFKINSLLIGVDSSALQEDDINIEWNKVGIFLAENIEIILE